MTDVHKENKPGNPIVHPPSHRKLPFPSDFLNITPVKSGVNYSSAWK